MNKKKDVRLNCFSPPIMVATLISEVVLALYTIWRYKMTVLARLAVITLLALATFQLSEYHVCTGCGLSAQNWSRLGYASITLLPALGLHLIHILAGKPKRALVSTAYATMIGFVAYFLIHKTAFIGYKCTGNYVIFQMGTRPAAAYGIYYFGWIIAAIYLGVRWANQFLAEGKKSLTKLQLTRSLIIGYLVFLIPTALANSISPASRHAIPSIMCGFAVFFALILAMYILPRSAKKRSINSTRKI